MKLVRLLKKLTEINDNAEIIPADFFSVLVSPNREIYAEALMKLYEMFRTEINIRLKSFLAEV